MTLKKIFDKRQGMALSQILLLIAGTIAIAYILGMNIGVVSAVTPPEPAPVERPTEIVGSSGTPASPGYPGAPMISPAGGTPGAPSSIPTPTTPPAPAGAEIPDITGTLRPNPAASGIPSQADKIKYLDKVWNAAKGSIETIGFNLAVSAALYFGVGALARLFKSEYADVWNALGQYLGGGWFIISSIYTVASVLLGHAITFLGSVISGGIGAVIGLFVFLFSFKKEKQESIIFNCYPWQPEPKGERCTQCGKDGLPCSKYQCQSLGQGCKFIDNPEQGEDYCVWSNRLDTEPPTINPWKEILKKDYKYEPNNAMSPPDKGVIVKYTKSDDGCAPPFSPISFGVALDKPGSCKISTTREASFEEMPDMYLSAGSSQVYNHSITISMAGTREAEAEEGITTEGSGEHELYVRCQSVNGYANVGNFVFQYCISPQPDTTPPSIIATDPLNGFPVQTGQTSIDVNLYVNKPSECRWSHTKQDFSSMADAFTCASSISEMNAQMLYKCTATLTGLIDEQENKFYFACRSYPLNPEEERYEMTEPYEYKLIGTRQLVIDSISPSGTVRGSSDTIKVTLKAETSAGYKDGAANCYYNEKCYKEDGKTDNFILFSYPAGTELFKEHKHAQELWLDEGNYECSIKCVDLGGNVDIETTTYNVEIDRQAPLVSRVYNEGSELKLITTEPAECVYDVMRCSYNFEDGMDMRSSDDLSHYADWNTRSSLYIKCRDKYGTQPAPDSCSIIVRPVEIY
jgi:hypothetical protein